MSKPMKLAAVLVASILCTASSYAADLGCDTPGVVQMIVPDLFSKNPSAQKLGLEIEAVTMLRVDRSGAEPVCFVKIETNHGYSFNYRFVYSDGVAKLDMTR